MSMKPRLIALYLYLSPWTWLLLSLKSKGGNLTGLGKVSKKSPSGRAKSWEHCTFNYLLEAASARAAGPKLWGLFIPAPSCCPPSNFFVSLWVTRFATRMPHQGKVACHTPPLKAFLPLTTQTCDVLFRRTVSCSIFYELYDNICMESMIRAVHILSLLDATPAVLHDRANIYNIR